MRRRRFVALGTVGMGLIAGCQSLSSTNAPTETTTATPTETPRENPNTIFVSPSDGSSEATGAKNNPIETIQEGFNRAQPGDTIYALPGHHSESVKTVRAGSPDDPITLTGPPDAVIHEKLVIRHSHIHITGGTFDGLQNPQKPEDPDSYAGGNITVNPLIIKGKANAETKADLNIIAPDYIRDIVIKPHAVGNTLGGMIGFSYTNNVEVGEFEVIGPGGLKHLLGVNRGHNGEVVYVGIPFAKWTSEVTHRKGTPIPPPLSDQPLDRSRNYHIHHIKQTGGHPHAELVDIKGGMSNVTIEYCTDKGGSGRYLLTPEKPRSSESAFNLRGSDTTLRWCVITDGHGNGIEIDIAEEFPDKVPNAGKNNAVYGNQIVGNEAFALHLPPSGSGDSDEGDGSEAQKVICGNEYTGKTHGDPDKTCPDGVPESDTIGHQGGDSPWT